MSQNHSVKTNEYHPPSALRNHLMEHQPQVDHLIQLLLELLQPQGERLKILNILSEVKRSFQFQYFIAIFNRISSIFEVLNIEIFNCLKIFFNFEILMPKALVRWPIHI